jgi:hypothetical protein
MIVHFWNNSNRFVQQPSSFPVVARGHGLRAVRHGNPSPAAGQGVIATFSTPSRWWANRS